MARTLIRAHGIYGRDDTLIVGRHPLADRMLGIAPKRAVVYGNTLAFERTHADSLIDAYGGRLAIYGAGCDRIAPIPGGLQFWFPHKRFDIVRATLEPSDLARLEIGAFSLVTYDFEPLIAYEGVELSEVKALTEHETGLRFVVRPIVDATPVCEVKNADDTLNPKPRGWFARLMRRR